MDKNKQGDEQPAEWQDGHHDNESDGAPGADGKPPRENMSLALKGRGIYGRAAMTTAVPKKEKRKKDRRSRFLHPDGEYLFILILDSLLFVLLVFGKVINQQIALFE